MISNVVCSHCSAPLSQGNPLAEPRYPCPHCGGTARTIATTLAASVIARDGVGIKGKRPGRKKPYVEDKSGPSFSHDHGKFVHRKVLIDRENDFYEETVKHYESGEVIHHRAEPLSDHVGHGSAKFNKPKYPRQG